MGNFCCQDNSHNSNEIDQEKLIIPTLTTEEKEDVAKKRLQYIENKYPPTKPVDKTKRIDIQVYDYKKHQQYINDWRD